MRSGAQLEDSRHRGVPDNASADVIQQTLQLFQRAVRERD